VILLGGGAAFWVYVKVKDYTHGITKTNKPPEEKSAVKPRVFGAPAGGGEGAAGESGVPSSAPSSAPAGQLGGQPGAAAPVPPAGAPPVPPPLGAARGASVPAAPADATVPPIAVAGGPARPAPLASRSAPAGGAAPAAYGGAPAGYGRGGGREASADDRSRYDTPFVVNGAVQPGGKAGSQLDETVRRGNEALAAMQATPRMPAFGGGSGSGGSEGGKGALTGMLTPTSTPMVRAGMLGNLNLTVRKGTPIECVLQTKIVAMLPGLVKCRLTSPLYSANGKVILADKGSDVIGEQSGTMRQGQTRLYVLWTEIDTPDGVTIPIDSPAADALGAAGVDGEVNNHWSERIGASLLLSLIDDAFAYQIAKAGAQSNTGTSGGVAFQSTQQQGQRIAEKVLDSTINIPPTLYKNQGEKISIIVARHLDFSSVYAVEAK
jgi:type IV secretion system protein VirB10